MNKVVDRILAQLPAKHTPLYLQQRQAPESDETTRRPKIQNQKLTPLTPDEVRALVLNEFMDAHPHTTVTTPLPKELLFDGIENFCTWYGIQTESFTTEQKAVLDTLMRARDAIFNGCNCKLEKRRRAANDYYQRFFIANKDTDLVPTIKAVGKVEKVQFSLNGSVFLSV